jgi:hypothetical protein
MSEEIPVEALISINRVLSENKETWNPALRDIMEHDFDPVWVASILFLLLDRYTSCVADKNQLKFVKDTLTIFKKMQSHGHDYLYKMEGK